MKTFRILLFTLSGAFIFTACKTDSSSSTGWDYNDPNNGGFQKVPYIDQETGPGLVLVEGGTFTMGRNEQDVMFDHNNRPRRVTVSSFYMDQTEVTNFHWNEYLYWLRRAYDEQFPQIYRNALPDTLCWRSELGFNEKYVDYYLRHPGYRDYPVVGVSWLQASDFCKWRTDRVNEFILVKSGVINFDPINQKDENVFDTDAYLANQGDANNVNRPVLDLDPAKSNGKKMGERNIAMSDGLLLPRYRLPTEAEWEYASYGLIGNLDKNSENISSRRTYPWDGHWVRNDQAEYQGQIRANFVRGRGDYMGVAGRLNDGGDVTVPVTAYWPNDFGLYNMAGNVSEWVMDVYRPLSSEDFDEFRPFRGNVFKTKVLNNEGMIDEKLVAVDYDVHAMKEYLNTFERTRYQRISASKHDVNDTVIPVGIYKSVESSYPVVSGQAPDPKFISHDRKKDVSELRILGMLNKLLDEAINLKNNKYDDEANEIVQEQIFNGVFVDSVRVGPNGDYAYEIITMLRQGLSKFIVNTPGKIKYRNVTEEENIGRQNYRKDDYIDYLDGDVESSIFYNNTDLKNSINDAKRDPKLLMYQNKYEEYGLDGVQVKPSGITSWPTTLISDRSRVYKGGSWEDRAYWQAGSSRRYLDERQSSKSIGFRCAMDRIGSPTGLNQNKKKNKS